MKTVIVVSLCESYNIVKDSFGEREYLYSFHFSGAYSGVEIKKIVVVTDAPYPFSIGEEYILYLEVLDSGKKRLRGRPIKYRPLKELMWT